MNHYWIIGAIIALLTVVGVLALFKKKTANAVVRNEHEEIPDRASACGSPEEKSLSDVSADLTIAFEETVALTELEEAQLLEIKDQELLGRLDQAIPGTMQVMMNTGAAQSLNQIDKIGGQIYRAIIPEGAVLDRSRAMEGAFRGSYREVANCIQGNANWLPVDTTAINKAAALNIGNALMGAAAMVVGQYYMTQISSQLDVLSDGLKRLSGFQDNEFKSKVQALLVEVRRLSVFQMEVAQNDELRKRELNHLKTLETKCVELLGQANLQIQDYTMQQGMAYDDYEAAVRGANKWFQYQNVLLELLYQISELTHALNYGVVSRAYSQAIFLTYAKQTENVHSKLLAWHEKNCKRLGINANQGKRKRAGLDAVLMAGPALFKEEWRYKKMMPGTVKAIRAQTEGKAAPETESQDFFQEKIQLIAKDGKLFYLPPVVEAELNTTEEQDNYQNAEGAQAPTVN